MRSFGTSLATLALAAAGPALFGQSPPSGPGNAPATPSPYPAALTVLTSQAEVYSGPSNAYYPTSRLRYGDRVIVLGESKKQPGWLEILPPPGSFSWIDARHVKVIPGVDKIGIVDAGDPKGTVPVLPGSMVVNKEPNVEIARVPTGTQVLLVDRQQSTNGATWYPIAPVATEVRFLPMEAVRSGATNVASNPWNTPAHPTSGGYPNTTANWPAAQQPANPNSLAQYNQLADQALAAGNTDRARLLYLEALNQTNDPAWRNYLQNQIARLAPASSWHPGTPTAGTPGTAPAYPVPNYNNAGTSPFSPTANSGVRPAVAEAVPGAPTNPPAGTGQKTWSDWGVLRSTTFTTREGMPMYVIEGRDTRSPVMYVTTQPGMSLREYVGQTIALYGTLAYRNDEYIRMQFLVAEQLATAPAKAAAR